MKKSFLQKYVLNAVIIAGWLLAGCHRTPKEQDDFFCYNESSGITSLDPAFAKNQSNIWAVHQLYNTLVETGSDMRIVPSLARSWTIAEDRLSVDFHLRTDVYFHDHPSFPQGKGRKLTAYDVVYSFQRLMDPKTASPGAWVFNNRVDPLTGFEALNDSVFRLRLLKPFVQILGVLSNPYCSIVPREAVESVAYAFRSNPCGSGPFQFFLWEEGQVMLFKKNPSYFEVDSLGNRLPYLKGIKISFLSGKAAEFLEFRQGRIDFINDIDPAFKDEILTKKGLLRDRWKGKINLLTHPYLNVEYLGILLDSQRMNGNPSPLKTKEIRLAINYAIDRKKIMLYLRNSIGEPAEYGFIPPGLPGFDSSTMHGYTYQPQKAVSLLNRAGFGSGGQRLKIKLLTIPTYADLASAVAKELSAVGIDVEIEAVQKSVLLTKTANRQADFFRASWIADYPDAENFLGLFYSKYPSPPNYTRYANPQYDQLYEACLKEVNDSARIILYKQMDKLIIQDAPVIPLWYDQVIHLVQPSIQQFVPNALNIPDLRRVKKVAAR